MSDARIAELEAKIGEYENEQGELEHDRAEAYDIIDRCNDRLSEIPHLISLLQEELCQEPFDEPI